MPKLKVVLFGGAFDPVHNGHLQVANTTLTMLPIDQVWFVPSGVPPLKDNVMFSFEERLKFLKEVIKDRPQFFVYEDDFQKNDRSYTIYLIQKLYSQFPEYKFSFLIGADNVMNLKSWYEYKKLLELIDFIVIDRDTDDHKEWQLLDYFHKLTFIKMPLYNVSSSKIREMIRDGKSVNKLIPKEICQFF